MDSTKIMVEKSNRLALIDADLIIYETAFGAQMKDPDTGEPDIKGWDWVQELLEHKLNLIQEESGSDSSLLFFTNTHHINKNLNRQRVREGLPINPYVPNFREALAVTQEYKSGRQEQKPYHFKNILAHLLAHYPCHVDERGLEADDAICMRQYASWKDQDTIICSRDKDLRQCPGLHFSWEMGKQAAIGPLFVDPLGWLEKRNEGAKTAAGKPKPVTLFGVGAKFFYAQLLMGDKVDSIGGIAGRGPAFAYTLLSDATTERECYELVSEVYIKTHGDDWKIKIKEQADLLWMVRELNVDETPKLWFPPKKDV